MKSSGLTMGRGLRVALVTALLAGGVAACSEAAPTNPTIEARQKNFKAIGAAFKTVGDELKTGKPDLAKVTPAAADLVKRTAQIKGYFPAGTGPETGAKTEAKPEIWTKQSEFAKYADDAVKAAGELEAAAGKGDVAALGTASAALGASCKGCHTNFREK